MRWALPRFHLCFLQGERSTAPPSNKEKGSHDELQNRNLKCIPTPFLDAVLPDVT